jgi:hypothetical protein
VVATWGATPTWATNVAPAGSVGSTSVGSTWTDIEHTVTLSSGFNNLIVFIWSGDTVANTDFIRIEAAQLEQGPYKTPFETRPTGMELALCQRYFERLVSRAAVGETLAFGGVRDTNNVYFLLQWQEKRTSPTLAFSATSTWTVLIDAASVTTTCTDIFGSEIGVRSCRCVYRDTSSPFTAGTVGRLRVAVGSANDATVDIDAEL